MIYRVHGTIAQKYNDMIKLSYSIIYATFF